MSYRDLDLEGYYFNQGWRITGNEVVASHEFLPQDIFFDGHFPTDPIVPGVVVIHGLLTAAKHLLEHRGWAAPRGIERMELQRVRFKKVLRPGDLITVRVTGEPSDGSAQFKATVFLKEERTAFAEFSIQKGDFHEQHLGT